jgi:tRNA uridine 5-carbamoylmethylation protein Kti12
MNINYIANNFGYIATNAQYTEYMQMDLQRYHIYTALLNTLKVIADDSNYLTDTVEEYHNITTIDTDDLIEVLEELGEGDYDINTNPEILQRFKDLQKEYIAQCEKIAEFKHSIMFGAK